MLVKILAAAALLVLAILLILQGMEVGIQAPIYTGLGFIVIAARDVVEGLKNRNAAN